MLKLKNFEFDMEGVENKNKFIFLKREKKNPRRGIFPSVVITAPPLIHSRLFIYLSIFLNVYLSTQEIYSSLYQPIFLNVYLSTQEIYRSLYQPIFLNVYLSTQEIYRSLYQPIFLSSLG